jgi:hypothetical protein
MRGVSREATESGGSSVKVIFLDIDGVLNNMESLRFPRIRVKSSEHSYSAAHPSCIAALNRIISETNARIVISSTWRGIGLEVMFEIFHQWGIAGMTVGYTPLWERSFERGDEIADWLSKHPEVTSFVILDDGDDMGVLKHRLVQTDYEIGLTEADADRAIAILNAPPTDLLIARMFAECGVIQE